MKQLSTGSELQVAGAETENAREEKVVSDAGWSGQKAGARRMLGWGWEVLGN